MNDIKETLNYNYNDKEVIRIMITVKFKRTALLNGSIKSIAEK